MNNETQVLGEVTLHSSIVRALLPHCRTTVTGAVEAARLSPEKGAECIERYFKEAIKGMLESLEGVEETLVGLEQWDIIGEQLYPIKSSLTLISEAIDADKEDRPNPTGHLESVYEGAMLFAMVFVGNAEFLGISGAFNAARTACFIRAIREADAHL